MRQMKWHNRIAAYAFCLLLVIVSGCSRESKDIEIKKDLTSKAKRDKAFAGVRFVVHEGIVRLSGECASEKDKSKVENLVKNLYAVKGVLNHSIIAPVVIGLDNQLKQSVDSTLKTYPGVMAVVKDSIVYLQGQADSRDEQTSLAAIQSLKPKQLQNEVTFR